MVFEDRPFGPQAPPRSILEAKMDPKWKPKPIKNLLQIEVKFRRAKMMPPSPSEVDFGIQNEAKLAPKIARKSDDF